MKKIDFISISRKKEKVFQAFFLFRIEPCLRNVQKSVLQTVEKTSRQKKKNSEISCKKESS